MGCGCFTNRPNEPVIFPYKLSGRGFYALMKLSYFYRDEPSKIIDRLVLEKAAELGRLERANELDKSNA